MPFFSRPRSRVFRIRTCRPVGHRMPPLAAARRRSGVRTRGTGPWVWPPSRGAVFSRAGAPARSVAHPVMRGLTGQWFSPGGVVRRTPAHAGPGLVFLPLLARRGEGTAPRRMVPASIASYDRPDHGDRLKINHAVYDSLGIRSLLHALPLPSGGGCRMMPAQMAAPRGCLWSRERLSELCPSSCASFHCSD